MSPVSPRCRPTSPVFKKNNKLNLAFVEDPLLATAATAAANVHTYGPQTPLTPPDDEDAPVFPEKRSARHDSVIDGLELEDDGFDTMSIPDVEPNKAEPQLMAHSKVYTIAEKYGIKGLKALSRRKFSTQMSHHWLSAEFPEAIQDVYDSTVDSDRGLRDVVIGSFREHPELARRKDVEEVVKETPNLAWELFRLGWGLPIVSD
jgi:hypothetical protein